MAAELDVLILEAAEASKPHVESTGLSSRRGLVAGHPEVQARVAAELESLGLLATPGNPTPRRLEYADLTKLPYMDAVLRESLRLLPVSAAGLQRITPRDKPVTDIGGYAVPANTEVLVCVLAVCVL